MTGVKGRTALVTGAGSADGIGFATARLLLAAGARVAITSTTDRIYDRLAELGREIRDDDIEPFTRFLHDRMLAISPLRLVEALQQIDIVSRDVARFYDAHDVWLTSTLPVPVPELGVIDTTNVDSVFAHAGRFSELTAVFNVTGQPAASIPAKLPEITTWPGQL